MVATTFAADTPLVVTGLVYRNGIAGNWFWWSFLPSGMMTVFLFARLWRRSGLLTDVQFAEMRYAGKPAAFLRGFRALYLGLLMNCLILGWVTKAMTAIVAISLGVSESTSKLICVLVLIPFTGLYVTLGGLWGVLWTDRKSTRLNSSHSQISYAVFCLKKNKKRNRKQLRLRKPCRRRLVTSPHSL